MAATLDRAWPEARRAVDWWTSELSALVPARLRQIKGRRRPPVALCIEGPSASILITGSRPSGSASQEPLTLREAAERAADAARKHGGEIEVRVPLRQVFTRHVTLPRMSASDLSRVLLLDLERLTPLKSADVMSAHIVCEVEGGRGQIHATQFVLKRKSIEPVVEAVAAAGGQVTWIGCWNEQNSAPLPICFKRGEKPSPASHTSRAVAAGLVLLMLSAPSLYIYRKHEAVAELHSKIDSVRKDAADVQRSIAKTETLTGLQTNLGRLQEGKGDVLATIEQLSRLLPDTVYLTTLRIASHSVEISGLAASAAELPQILERSHMFTDAVLTAPVTVESRDGRERFSLKARFRSERGHEAGSIKP